MQHDGYASFIQVIQQLLNSGGNKGNNMKLILNAFLGGGGNGQAPPSSQPK